MKEQAYMTELYMEYERLMFVIAGRYAADPSGTGGTQVTLTIAPAGQS